jgi:phage repressor protein C with HTH and peptisase S24 domain
MSPTTRDLDAEVWPRYFDSLTQSSEGLLASIELMSEELGDQSDVERMPLQAISYDPRDDVLEVAVGGRGARYPIVLRHFISNPKTISVEENGEPDPAAIEVTDPSGVRTLIRLFETPALEP